MTKQRLDKLLVSRGLVPTRSQAESYIRLGAVMVDGKSAEKAGLLVSSEARLSLQVEQQYVSRAAQKLASVASRLELDFQDAVVLDVGSSTGGFTDFALRHGAKQVFAVEVGTNQMHPSLRQDARISLYEKTDIRDVRLATQRGKDSDKGMVLLTSRPDIILADVSFISLRAILPAIARLAGNATRIVIMFKPQFESNSRAESHKGVIKNDAMRRTLIKDFEEWLKHRFVIEAKADSTVAGMKGNRERFYVLRELRPTLNRRLEKH